MTTPQAPTQQPNNLGAKPAVVTATLTIKRKATGKVGTEIVKQAATFVGPEREFLKPWAPPPTKGDLRLASNLSAAEEFMRRTEQTA